MSADPNDAPAAFAEYAADRIWVATHLGQFPVSYTHLTLPTIYSV